VSVEATFLGGAGPLKAAVIRILTILGLLVGMTAIATMRRSSTWLSLRSPDDGLIHPERLRPTWRDWALLVLSATATVVFWYVLLVDQDRGGHRVWLLYAATGAMLLYAAIWMGFYASFWPL
jgi:hypothetical protein